MVGFLEKVIELYICILFVLTELVWNIFVS